jgi:glucokinase
MNDRALPFAEAVSGRHAQAATGLALPWLLADIGGTNARFGWLDASSGDVQHVSTLAAADCAGPAEAASLYLQRLAQQLGPGYSPPRAAAFAVATAVSGDWVSFTNSGWAFSRTATQAQLGLQELLILNDFEALALSLPHLKTQQLRAVGPLLLQTPVPMSAGALAVIGPGTGLGVAGIVPAPGGIAWVALPGEGGHATLSAADDFEAALLQHVRQQYSHVSAERLLSGIGLPVLHGAVAAVLGQAGSASVLTAPDIVERAVTAADPVCQRTIDSFCALLGSFAGNVALTLGARGGVYIGGGIVPRLGPLFMNSRFRERFEAKGRFEAYLRAVPTAVIVDTLAALTGAASGLAQQRR